MTDKVPKGLAIRPVQVFAAALSAVTGAFLASRLGVYGTVVGAGVFSVMSTVGTELYLRSLERTREAARRAKLVALTHGGRMAQVRFQQKPADAGAAEPAKEELTQQELTQQELTQQEVAAAVDPAEPRKRRLRWPLIAAVTVVAFALGMLAVTGIEFATGKTLSGEEGKTISQVVTGGGAAEQDNDQQQPEPEPSPEPSPEPREAPEPTTSEPPAPTETEPPAEDPAPEDPAPEDQEPDAPSDEEPAEDPEAPEPDSVPLRP